MAAHSPIQLSLVPGTPAEQRQLARSFIRRGEKPIRIAKVGRAWEIVVLGTPIGFLKSKIDARSAAHHIGNYRLGLGDFVYSYTEGY